MDLEVYVHDVDIGGLIQWLGVKLGSLHRMEMPGSLVGLNVVERNIRVTITPSVEDGPFLSLFVVGDHIPWASSEEMAIDIAQETRKIVRWCDDSTNQWIEKRVGLSPSVIEWDD